jgi:hypothetical protein
VKHVLCDKKTHCLDVEVRSIYSKRWAFEKIIQNSKGRYNRVLVGKPEGRRPLERPRRRWEDNIEIHLREVAWTG